MLLPIPLAQAVLATALATGVYLIVKALHNLYLHPLSRFPGPRAWAISRVPYVYTLVRGDLTRKTQELHEHYGPFVRLAPNELSFIDAQGWQDIYSHHQGRPNFPKNPIWMAPASNGIHSILSANDADHARYRRLLSHAFSERALKQQEHLVQSYIELLVEKLRECASTPNTAVVDLVQWLNFTTFDIIGDLSLGESFHCLEIGSYHSWLAILSNQFKTATLLVSLRLVGLGRPLRMLIPQSMLRKREEHTAIANRKIHRRLDKGKLADDQRNDFMTYILRHNDEKGMSVLEIEATMRILVLAGSETTATALSGIFGNLLRNPSTMETLVGEIRDSFRHVSEIDADRVSSLPYLSAVIEEGLRLCPPVALGMPRVVPASGATVSGHWLPGGTYVSASGFASNRSSLNFPDSPSTFEPSRWLSRSSITDTNSLSSSTPAAFNPFSLGPRNCLGRNLAYLEMRLILAHLIWAFDFELQGNVSRWEDQKTWILWEKKPLYVQVKSRNLPH